MDEVSGIVERFSILDLMSANWNTRFLGASVWWTAPDLGMLLEAAKVKFSLRGGAVREGVPTLCFVANPALVMNLFDSGTLLQSH